MTPFVRFLAFEAIGWVAAAVLLVWLAGAGHVPVWAAVLLFALWVVKDFALYPLTRRAYEDGHAHGAGELLGTVVQVETRLAPDGREGYVRAGTERWRARLVEGCANAIEPGGLARVRGLEGITLVVEGVGGSQSRAGEG